MLVRDLMNPKPAVARPSMSVPEALSIMREKGVYQMPVLDGLGHLAGVVAEQDLLHATATSVTSLSVWEIPALIAHVKVEAVMVKDVVCVAEDTAAEEAARVMADKGIGCLPVMRGKKMVGFITKNDIFMSLMELLGGMASGIRVWAITPSGKGTVARITSAVSAASGNIVGLGYHEVRDSGGSRWHMTLKVQDISRERLLEALKPVVTEILDVHEG